MTQKRILALLLALVLCLSAGAVLAEDRTLFSRPRYEDMTPEEMDEVEYFSIQSSATDGEAIYILLSRDETQEIYRYRLGEEEPTLLLQQPFLYYDIANEEEIEGLTPEEKESLSGFADQLVTGDGAAYALNLYTGRLGRLTDAGIEWIETDLQLPDLVVRERDYSYTREMMVSYVRDGVFYLGVRGEDWEQCDLYAVNLETGASEGEWNFPVYTQLTPYKDGLMLTTSVDERTGASSLVAVDPESGTQETLPVDLKTSEYQTPYTLCYDEETDAIYYLMNSQVSCVQGGEGTPEVMVYFSGMDSGARNSFVLDGHYILHNYEGLYIRDLSRGVAEYRPLRIAGGWVTSAIRKFSENHPETPVLTVDRYFDTSQDLANAIMSGEEELDIFALSVGYSEYAALKQKGYMADLSGSGQITDAVARMHPEIAGHLLDDQGRVVAIPYDVYMDGWSVNLTLWEEHYPGQELPATWAEWIDLYIDWQDTHDREDEIGFYRGYDEKYDLLYTIYNGYIRLCERDGKELDFEAPAFREVMERLADVEFYEPDWETMTDADHEELSEYANSPCIFTNYGAGVFTDPDAEQFHWDSSDETEEDRHQFYPEPVFHEGQQPAVPYNMDVYFVNPNTPNLDVAIELLAAQLEGLEDRTQYMIYTDKTEPLPNKYYEYSLRNQEKYVRELRDSLEKADPEEKRNLEEEIEQQERYIEYFTRTGQWELTEGAIRAYQEGVAPYLYLNESSLFRNYEGEDSSGQILNQIFYRYLEGESTLDEMLKELTQKTRMMEREAQ